MVRKKLAIAILALSALQANFADAMGLGNLSIKSALNQPLNAEIKLLDTGDLDPSQIKIQLAAPEDFQRAGVDREFFLTNLRFSVDMDGHGGGTIKITTREPVVEPYLNFVIEARWPNGRLLREFAVLLDPPTFSANKATAPLAPAASAGVQTAKPRAVQPPAVKTEAETTTATPPTDMSLPAAGKSGEYRIQVYDTLSKIAARFKPASDVSVAQTMIAIQRANPQVFIHNNVNLIKSGYVLRLPSADEARALASDQAAQEVDAQTQDWRGSRSSGATATRAAAAGPQLDASAPEPSKKEGGYREQARLSIATAGETDKGVAGGGSGKGFDTLRKQLTESQESLEKGKRDNKELQSRLDDMERQIATLQRLISLKDDQLAALQAKSVSAKPVPQPVPEPVKAAPTTPPAATTEPAAVTEAAPATPAPAAQPASVNPAAKPPVKPVTPAPESGLASKLVADPMYLYGGIAAILIALLSPFVFKRFQRRGEESASDTLSFDAEDSFQFDTDTIDDTHGEGAADEADVTTAEVEEVAQSTTEAPKKAVRSETGDPIAESDIYIAYGRYQQAVDLLTHAIDAEPNRSDLRVKLLEVYVEMRNKDAFGQQFVALQSLGDSDAVARVKDLLSSVDGIADWLDDLPLSANTSAHAAGISSFAASAATAAVATAAASTAPDLDLDLDFDSEPTTGEPVAPALDLGASVSDDFESLESSFTGTGKEEPAEFDFDLDDEFDADGTGANISADFLSKQEPSPDIGTTSFEPSRFEAPNFETNSFEPAKTDDSGAAAFEEAGLDLDLGDDDLDQALSRMDDTENLGDLEEMSAAFGAVDAQSAPAPVDLSADFGELPEEFDLSQPGTELPEVDRASGSDFGDLSFEEPSFEANPTPQPEIDVFAGLNQVSPPPVFAPEQAVAPVPALDGGDDFDFLADADEVATKLDLARAYIDMGDTDGAKDILDEVLQEGTDTQKQEASTLLNRMA